MPVKATLEGWTAGLILFVVLAVLIPLTFSQVGAAAVAAPEILLAVAVTWLVALRISLLFAKGHLALMQLTFWCFVYLFFCVPALAQLSSETFPLPSGVDYGGDVRLRALLNIAIGLVAYEIGLLLARRGTRARAITDRLSSALIVPKRVWALAVFGILVSASLVATTGLAVRFRSRQAAEAVLFGQSPDAVRLFELQNKAAGLIKISLISVPVFIALYLLLHLRRSADDEGTGKRRRLPLVNTTAASVLLAVLIVVNLVVNNPISTSRFRFGTVALSILVVLLPFRRKAQFRVAVVALLVLMVVVFPQADAFRRNVDETFSARLLPMREDISVSPDYSMFQQEMNGLLYVEENGHTLGEQSLNALFFWVPRQVWADQGEDTGDLIDRTDRINAASTLWTEASVEAGPVGVFTFFLFYGWVSFALDEAYRRRPRHGATLAGAAVPLFAAFQFLFLRGSLLAVLPELAAFGVFLVPCALMAGRSPAASSAGSLAQARPVRRASMRVG